MSRFAQQLVRPFVDLKRMARRSSRRCWRGRGLSQGLSHRGHSPLCSFRCNGIVHFTRTNDWPRSNISRPICRMHRQRFHQRPKWTWHGVAGSPRSVVMIATTLKKTRRPDDLGSVCSCSRARLVQFCHRTPAGLGTQSQVSMIPRYQYPSITDTPNRVSTHKLLGFALRDPLTQHRSPSVSFPQTFA